LVGCRHTARLFKASNEYYLNGKALTFTDETALLGAIPELDSMAVVALLTMLEDSLGLSIADDEIDGEVFATVASLLAFVQAKLA
jgi:acyl carrier protein